ncbi:hypothetical protein GWI33_003571 [Rhynchophorus ferrugineus]|uniref:Uncharacterized protein n=1 Tax=Rhynchophorus ferrugineus TaxID=354439 RepID=A0A834HM98_RHYFE|nr:hypothetical protein GWI33_003571 [Rhynchophorus ferrugineus]
MEGNSRKTNDAFMKQKTSAQNTTLKKHSALNWAIKLQYLSDISRSNRPPPPPAPPRPPVRAFKIRIPTN